MAKGKRKGGSSGGPHKNHGPKKHLFKEYKPMVHIFAQTGILSKYYNYESWAMACNAKGKKQTPHSEFQEFLRLKPEEKKLFFKELKRA